MQKKKIIHLVIPTEDEDLIRWKEALPPRTFNRYVNSILREYAKGRYAVIPYKLSTAEEIKPVNGRIVVTNPDALALIKKMKKGHATEEIKEIIRKCIRYNTEHPQKAKTIVTDRLIQVMDDFKIRMAAKAIIVVGFPSQYRKLCAFYELAMTKFYSALLDCMESATNSAANAKLLHLDTETIVNDVFAAVFTDENETNHNEKENSENEQLFNP